MFRRIPTAGPPPFRDDRIWYMVLSEQEESLIKVVRELPPDDAGKILNWALQLTDLAKGRAIEWSVPHMHDAPASDPSGKHARVRVVLVPGCPRMRSVELFALTGNPVNSENSIPITAHFPVGAEICLSACWVLDVSCTRRCWR